MDPNVFDVALFAQVEDVAEGDIAFIEELFVLYFKQMDESLPKLKTSMCAALRPRESEACARACVHV